MFAQMIFPVESFSTFAANLIYGANKFEIVVEMQLQWVQQRHGAGTYLTLITAMNYKVQIKMLFSLKAFFTNATNVRTLRTVAEFVPFQMLLSLQSSAANVTDVPPFDFVHR